MKLKTYVKILFLLSIAFSLSFNAFGQDIYGKAKMEKGNATIILNGKKTQILPTSGEITVYTGSLIRTGPNSTMLIKTKEKADLYIQSNAIFKIDDWKKENKRGFVSFLYGKFKALISGLNGKEEFNVKTAKSVIGVKGTEYMMFVDKNAKTLVEVLESRVFATSNDGNEVIIEEKTFSFTDGEGRFVSPAPVTPEIRQKFEALDPANPAETSPEQQTNTVEKLLDIPPDNAVDDQVEDNNQIQEDIQEAIDEASQSATETLNENNESTKQITIKLDL